MPRVSGTVEVAVQCDGADVVVKFEGLQVLLFADAPGKPSLQIYQAQTNADGVFRFPEMDTGTQCVLLFPAVGEFKGKPAGIRSLSQVVFALTDGTTRDARYASGVTIDPQPGTEAERLQAEIRGYTDTHMPELDRRLVEQSERPASPAALRRISVRLAANADAKAELRKLHDEAAQGADLPAIAASARGTFHAALTNSNDLLDKDLKYSVPAGRLPATPTNRGTQP